MESSPTPLPPRAVGAPVTPRLRLPGLIIARLVIVGSLIYVVQSHAVYNRLAKLRRVRPNLELNLTARYLIGLHERNKLAPPKGGPVDLTQNLGRTGQSPLENLRNEIVRGALQDRPADATVLAEIAKTAPYLRGDVDATLQANELPRDQWQIFQQRHGWLARLARAQASHWKHEDWPVMRKEARQTVVLYSAMEMLACFTFMASIVLLAIILRRWGKGDLPVRLTRPETPWTSCFIEAFAIYIGAFVFADLLCSTWLVQAPYATYYAVLAPFIALAILWPRLRGMESASWRQVMGWHRGAGVRREIGYGLLGWIAGLPLLALGWGLSKWIEHVTGLTVSQPVLDPLMQPGWGRWGMIALAVLWAPVIEEAMFRGALFPAWARLLSWIPGALLASFVFASVHPQGWVGAPPIVALALTQSALRSFRGALIAPMTAHALNNTLACLMMMIGT